jgi:putative ubiquitin-RnfH superfamily antitoxin RatB of RatAB toxin-antitoxin module
MEVTVVFLTGRTRRARERRLELPEGATVAEAVTQSGWEDEVAARPKVSRCWGSGAARRRRTRCCADQDRVEIYRL